MFIRYIRLLYVMKKVWSHHLSFVELNRLYSVYLSSVHNYIQYSMTRYCHWEWFKCLLLQGLPSKAIGSKTKFVYYSLIICFYPYHHSSFIYCYQIYSYPLSGPNCHFVFDSRGKLSGWGREHYGMQVIGCRGVTLWAGVIVIGCWDCDRWLGAGVWPYEQVWLWLVVGTVTARWLVQGCDLMSRCDCDWLLGLWQVIGRRGVTLWAGVIVIGCWDCDRWLGAGVWPYEQVWLWLVVGTVTARWLVQGCDLMSRCDCDWLLGLWQVIGRRGVTLWAGVIVIGCWDCDRWLGAGVWPYEQVWLWLVVGTVTARWLVQGCDHMSRCDCDWLLGLWQVIGRRGVTLWAGVIVIGCWDCDS